MRVAPSGRSTSCYQGYHQSLESELGVPEVLQSLIQERLVSRCLRASGHVAEHLLHHTFLTARSLCQQLPKLSRVGKLRIRDTGHSASGVNVQQNFFWFGPTRSDTMQIGIEQQLVLLAPGADGI